MSNNININKFSYDYTNCNYHERDRRARMFDQKVAFETWHNQADLQVKKRCTVYLNVIKSL